MLTETDFSAKIEEKLNYLVLQNHHIKLIRLFIIFFAISKLRHLFFLADFQREKSLIFAKTIFVLSLYFTEVAHEVARLMIGHIMSKSDGQICNSLEKGILLSDNENSNEISIYLN